MSDQARVDDAARRSIDLLAQLPAVTADTTWSWALLSDTIDSFHPIVWGSRHPALAMTEQLGFVELNNFTWIPSVLVGLPRSLSAEDREILVRQLHELPDVSSVIPNVAPSSGPAVETPELEL